MTEYKLKTGYIGSENPYQKGKYHCTIDLLFDWFEFYQTNKSSKAAKSKQKNRRLAIQWYFPFLGSCSRPGLGHFKRKKIFWSIFRWRVHKRLSFVLFLHRYYFWQARQWLLGSIKRLHCSDNCKPPLAMHNHHHHHCCCCCCCMDGWIF